MKTGFQRLLAILMLVCMFAQTTALAAEDTTAYDPAHGYLVSSVRTEQADGSYIVEKTYTNHSPDFYMHRIYGTDTFCKVSEKYSAADTLLLQYKVAASFDWSLNSQITRVYSPSCEVLYHKNDKLSHESVLTMGSETCKSSVIYHFLRTTDAGTLEDYLITLSCDYLGRVE